MYKELIEIAKQTIEKCFDDKKYLHTVGCALKTKSGKIYTGVNVDGIHGTCAEIVTIGTAVANDESEFDAIVAVYGKGSDQKILPPCGNCRQIMYEIDKNIKVVIAEDKIVPIKDLLPYPCL